MSKFQRKYSLDQLKALKKQVAAHVRERQRLVTLLEKEQVRGNHYLDANTPGWREVNGDHTAYKEHQAYFLALDGMLYRLGH